MFFTQKRGRFFVKGKEGNIEFHLRGPRYIVALDPQYSVLQKLEILLEDIEDCNQYIHYKYIFNKDKQYIILAPILDYLKNALITLFNSYIHKEKLGIFNLDNESYEAYRHIFLEAINTSVYAYYSSLANKLTPNDLVNLKSLIDSDLIKNIAEYIRLEFRSFKFSSKSMVRPEASHPLVLIGYAFNISRKYPKCDFILGMPFGATEIACLTHQIIKNFHNHKECKLYLLPISFHTVKDVKQPKEIDYSVFVNLLPNVENTNEKTCLIIDDNSATGRTIEQAWMTIKSQMPNINVICSVAEIDLYRIKMNLKDTKKKYVFSNPEIYKYSVNILPVSKIIKPKFDLKEIIEKRMLYNYYKNLQAESQVEQIVNEVIADCIEHKMEDEIQNYNKQNAILSFKHTFLSNFYAVPIVYNERLYSSVEQAYLRQKFDSKLLSSLNSKQKKELNEILKFKGILIQRSDFSKAFNDFNLAAGILKRWAEKLKLWGYEDKEWDNKRLLIMTELLILKFSHIELMERLITTKDMYLIEGNTWDDTFWGVCNNSGRNYLGRLLMNIRNKILNGELKRVGLGEFHPLSSHRTLREPLDS